MAIDQKNDVSWPSEPKYFQWKGTLSINGNTTNVLAHCKPRKEDVFIKIKQIENESDSDIAQFTETTTKLTNTKHPNLLTPVHAFVHKAEIWVIYPRHSGGPLIEILSSHYPNGIPDESIVSSILYDIACGLNNLHKHQQCHRNIRASSIHIDIDAGSALLTEFGKLKKIKYRKNRRNTMVDPAREPFTDPLILLSDDTVSWYSGDMYAFGITALQLTYGSTPPLNIKNIIQLKTTNISVDLYDKKCPFSKSFENLIKDCCNSNTQSRIKSKKLLEHKFFKLKCDKSFVKQTFGHILKSTEKRINPSLTQPISFNIGNTTGNITGTIVSSDINGHSSSINNNNNNENDNTLNNPINMDQKIKNGLNTQNNNNNNDNNSFTFSTTISRSSLKNNIQILQQQQPTIDEKAPHDISSSVGPTMHMHTNIQSKFNSPTDQHQHKNINDNNDNNALLNDNKNKNKKTRKYNISFSESTSMSHDLVDHDQINDDNTDILAGKPQATHGRFKVEFGSRYSESGTGGTHIEPSLTDDNDDNDVVQPQSDNDDDQPQPQQTNIQTNNNTNNQQISNDNANNNNTQHQKQKTKEIGRFIVATAKADNTLSADDDPTDNDNDNNNNVNQSNILNNNNNNIGGGQQQQQHTQQATIQPQPQATTTTHNKQNWNAKQCAQWVGSLGDSYKQYMQTFIDSGIDGDFMNEIDDAILADVVSSALHRKKILFAWSKL